MTARLAIPILRHRLIGAYRSPHAEVSPATTNNFEAASVLISLIQ
jgi:hypothetical protein